MSKLSKEAYKGCRDFFPKDKRKQDFLFDAMKKSAHLFGYEPYDGPLLEPIELYLAKSGEELINEQIYSFIDRGERKVAIRPEMTPTLARMIAQVAREIPKPMRWYAIPNLMRYEKPQRGRLREHWQFNADVFGLENGFGELEILQLICHLLNSFGASEKHFEILINDRNFVEGVLSKAQLIEPEKRLHFYKLLDRSKKISAAELINGLEKLSLSIETTNFLLDYLKLSSIDELKIFSNKFQLESQSSNLLQISNLCKESQIDKYLKYDPSIVRGLDYYTGLVFEVFDKNPENRRAICGGGAYANLLQIFNEPPIPAVGFGLGDVTLQDFLKTHQLLPEFESADVSMVVSYQVEEAKIKALNLVETLRKENISCEFLPGVQKNKKVFQMTDYKKHPFAIFIGEDEFNANKISLRNLQTKENFLMNLDDQIATNIKKLL